jgi:subtilase family serine protease
MKGLSALQRIGFTAAASFFVLACATLLAPSRGVAAVEFASVPNVRVRDLGEATPNTPISLQVTLNYHNPLQLEQLVALQNDPASPYFHHWLTSAQFESAFAPSPSDYLRVVRSLEAAGFRVTRAFSNRTVVDAAGTVNAAERYFHTAIHRVYQPGHGLRYANVRAAMAPFDVQDLVYSVNGLNNVAIARADFAPVQRRRVNPNTNTAPPYTGPVSSLTGYNGYGPLVFAQSYDWPSQHATKTDRYDGAGHAGAIVIDADFLNGDVSAYLKYFKIKRTASIVRVPIDGGTTSDPGLSSGDSIEATLDVEVLAGGAPGAALYVYETAPFAWGNGVITDAYNAVVAQNKVDTVNSSFGLCELSDTSATKAWDHIATQGAALGITFHAATGDDGADCDVTSIGINAPASSPHIVAVGGTVLNVDAKKDYAYESETGWGGSGGGTSSVFTAPAWQKGVKGMLGSGRNVPDVAFDANPLTGFPIYYAGTWNNPWNPLGGTSLASPLFGVALLQINSVTGNRSGLAAQSLYGLFKKDDYKKGAVTYFHDITSGSNGIFSAAPGYDRVTGIGSIDAWNIAQALKT